MESSPNRILVAMSGGVDSSVAACILKDEGHEVIGASMNLLTCNRALERSCCTAADRQDAREVCRRLGVPHHVFDYRNLFREKVILPFIDEYLMGRTPSPCILCNEHLKFAALFEEAEKLGAAHVATGHYARIDKVPSPLVGEGRGEGNCRFKLQKGVDPSKDQSYFLFTLDEARLSKLIFPIGHRTKAEVRKIALDAGLPVKDKPESQEICFVPDDDYASFVESAAGERIHGPGNFVDADGKILGRHRGIHAYTIGQRRGLGFGVGRRQYVVGINPERNEVVLGSNDDLMRDEMTVEGVRWVSAGHPDRKGVSVKIRSTHKGELADLRRAGEGSVGVRFRKPVRAIAPGQAAVFYDGEEVLGGGWISE